MKKYFPVIAIIAAFFFCLSIYQWVIFHDGKLHITVCDVGQGDAVFLRTPAGHDILFDSGPDAKVIECLARQMPFWDKSIDLLILSHPHADHYSGFVDVLEVYQVDEFMTGEVSYASSGFAVLTDKLVAKKINWQKLSRGDKLRTADGVNLTVLGPVKSPDILADTSGMVDGLEINAQSLEILVSYRDFDLLLTGDSQASQLMAALTQSNLPHIDVLQVPHHGSQTGLSDEVIRLIQPRLATISDGRKNRYGHPSPQVLTLLKNHHIDVLRTDQTGDVRLKSDGKSYNVDWGFL